MENVAINAFHVISRNAAGSIPYGALVKRSAAGTSVMCVDGSNTMGYEGVAERRSIEGAVAGKYSTYDPVPVICAGVVNLNVIGGGTDITAGAFLKIANDLGCAAYDSTTLATSTSVAKALEDQEISDYTTTLSTGTAGSKTLTVTSTTNFLKGDMVLMDGATGAVTDTEIGVIDTIDSSTQITLVDACALGYSGNNLRKIIQVKCLLL